MSILGLFNTPIFQRKAPNEVHIRCALKLHRKLQATLLKLKRRREASWRRIRECGARHDFADMMQHVEEAASIVKDERLFRSLGPPTVGRNHFILSSLTLMDSFRYTTQTADEGAHFIIGFDLDGCAVGTRMVTFPYAKQTVAGATGDLQATTRAVFQTYEWKHRPLVLIHSHPGHGLEANHHSCIDANTQKLWEHSARMISGVWSRSGHLRFFSHELPFEVTVVGDYVRKLEENVYQIEERAEENCSAL